MNKAVFFFLLLFCITQTHDVSVFLYAKENTVRLAVTFCMNFSSYLLPTAVIHLIAFIILVLSIVLALTLLNQNNQLLLIHDKSNLKLYTFLAIDIQAKVYLHKYLNYKSTATCFG